MKRSTQELALMLLPVVIVVVVTLTWVSYAGNHGSPDYLFFFSALGILLLTALLVGGFRYYEANPFVGLLTAFSLLLLLPLSHAGASGNLICKVVFGVVTGLGGGFLTLAFLVLSITEMRRAPGGNPSEGNVRDTTPSRPTARSESFTSASAWGSQQDRSV